MFGTRTQIQPIEIIKGDLYKTQIKEISKIYIISLICVDKIISY